MKPFIAAIQFITILPLGKPGTYDPMGMIAFFPVVGLILGGMVSALDAGAGRLFPQAAAVLDVIFLAAVTGALHLDGLSDTADGLLAHHSREKSLAIMKDSRIGAMGAVVLFCVLALKTVGIMGLDAHRGLLLILVPAYARGAMIFGVRFLTYGRPSGTGVDLFSQPLPAMAFAGLALPVGISVLLGWPALLLNAGFLLIVGVILLYYKSRIDCITGDMLGAMTEVCEALLFLIASIKVAP